MNYPQYPPNYPPGYGQQPVTPPAPVSASLDDFLQQPNAGGGPALKFHEKPLNTSYTGVIARPITDADIRQQTDLNQRPLTFRDGRPKLVMVVPLVVTQSEAFPDGRATWWVKGQAREELARAMAEAGAPTGPPEAGAGVTVTLVDKRPIPNLAQPAHVYRVTYRRPEDASPQHATNQAPAEPEQRPALGGDQQDLLAQLRNQRAS